MRLYIHTIPSVSTPASSTPSRINLLFISLVGCLGSRVWVGVFVGGSRLLGLYFLVVWTWWLFHLQKPIWCVSMSPERQWSYVSIHEFIRYVLSVRISWSHGWCWRPDLSFFFTATPGLCPCTSIFRRTNRPLTPILLKSIAIHLPFVSRYFCKSMPSSWQKVVYTPSICITIRLHLYCGTFAEVLGSEVVGEPATSAIWPDGQSYVCPSHLTRVQTRSTRHHF